MNKLSRKISAFVLCTALCLSGAASAFAAEKRIDGDADAVPGEIVKDETVYVFADSDGSVRKIIVSDWIKNTPRADLVTDFTELTELENVKGDEECTISENTAVWDARGNDIYYQGKTEKDLPVEVTVSYELAGEKVSAEEIAGKSGRVSIRFDYKNRQQETVTLDGKEEKLYVPFAVLTGALLDNEHFRNVTVSNGRLVNDGDRTAVIGFAFPGLQENLGIGKDKIDIPDHVEITADVTDFSQGMTVTMAVNSIFNNFDSAKFDSVDGMTESVGELAAGMEQLLDGSSALFTGLSTLLDKSEELAAGINQLADGAIALKDGAASLDDGAAQVKEGSTELSTGLDTLKNNNDALTDGAKQVFESLLSTAETQLKAGGISVPALTIDNYSQVLDEIASEEVQSRLTAVSEEAKTVAALRSSLDSFNAFYLGLLTYTESVASAADGASALAVGASELKNGTSQLKDGAAALKDGITEMKDASPALTDGVSKLKDGAMQLSDGLIKFNEEGIQKIIDLVNGNLDDLAVRLRATIDASKKYRNFSGICDDMDGQVKFIYRTDEIN